MEYNLTFSFGLFSYLIILLNKDKFDSLQAQIKWWWWWWGSQNPLEISNLYIYIVKSSNIGLGLSLQTQTLIPPKSMDPRM